jgi:hypothetical protein
MRSRHLVLCGGEARASRGRAWRDAAHLPLRLGKRRDDVHLRLDHITRKMGLGLPDVAVDLLEVAAFVYVADQCVRRGGTASFDYGDRWRRQFRFEIPVRRPDVWQSAAVSGALAETLGFLAEDEYEFGFVPLKHPPTPDAYLFDGFAADEPSDYQEVVLFSGGQDSLGGVVQEVLQGQRKVCLVSHRPTPKVYGRQTRLYDAVVARLPDPRLTPWHVAVAVNKGKGLGHDFTQRTRSFLFAAVAAAVARLFRLNRVRFYENGVVSLNLPVSRQLVGARSSRTTHPQVLKHYERLFGALFGERFEVQNPFLWHTRADILRQVKAAGHAGLLAHTVSCVHTMAGTQAHPHCGRCSQCVNRRLGGLAAGLSDAEDPACGYASDVLTGPREGTDLAFVEGYYASAVRTDGLPDAAAFLAYYPEVARVLRYLDVPAAAAGEQVFRLHQRHAKEVCDVMARVFRHESYNIARWQHPPNCLLSIALGRSVQAAPAAPNGPIAAPPRSRSPIEFPAGTFELRVNGKPCDLGNTKEYALAVRLARALGRYLSVGTLREDVWDDFKTEKNTIQRTVSNLRKKLREAGITDLVIDGRQYDHYRLVFVD